jgi:hypothetical protein
MQHAGVWLIFRVNHPEGFMPHRRIRKQTRRTKDHSFSIINTVLPRVVEATLTTAAATVATELIRQLFAHHIV